MAKKMHGVSEKQAEISQPGTQSLQDLWSSAWLYSSVWIMPDLLS